jgi:hypothetical protein
MEQKWRHAVLRTELRQNAIAIRDLATKLQNDSYPTEAPAALCALIAASARTVSKHLDDAPDEQLPFVHDFLCTIGEHLRYVERSQTKHTPWSMVDSGESFLRAQIGSDARFIIRPQWAYNYKIVGEFASNYRRRLEALYWIPSADWQEDFAKPVRVYCISFPRIERLNALLHTNWAHEVGHIVAQEWSTAHFGTFWAATVQPLMVAEYKRIQARVPKDEKQLDMVPDNQESTFLQTAMSVTSRALSEMIADAVSVHLLGPAALAAAIEVAARYDIDMSPTQSSAYYPTWRYRLQLMGSYCKNDIETLARKAASEPRYAHFLPFCTFLTEVMDSMKEEVFAPYDSRASIPYAEIAKQWPRISPVALGSLLGFPASAYSLSTEMEHVSDLVGKLAERIPPNEYGTWPNTQPARLQDILNAAWVQKAALRAAKRTDAETLDVLHRLVLKAIESSRVHDVYGPQLATGGAS